MDEVINNLEHDCTYADIYSKIETEESTGIFTRKINIGRETDNLLSIMVEISWIETGEKRKYLLQSLFYMEE